MVNSNTLTQLFSVLQGKSEQQTSILKDSEPINIVKELQEKIHQLETDLQKS